MFSGRVENAYAWPVRVHSLLGTQETCTPRDTGNSFLYSSNVTLWRRAFWSKAVADAWSPVPSINSLIPIMSLIRPFCVDQQAASWPALANWVKLPLITALSRRLIMYGLLSCSEIDASVWTIHRTRLYTNSFLFVLKLLIHKSFYAFLFKITCWGARITVSTLVFHPTLITPPPPYWLYPLTFWRLLVYPFPA